MYGIAEEDIYFKNPSSREYIKSGEILIIPKKAPHSIPDSVSTVEPGEQKDELRIVHSIQPKETLYGISKQYNVSVDEIMKLNPGLTAETFAVGRIINVPAVVTPISSENPVVLTEINYEVKEKETIYSICKQFNISNENLMEYNPELNSGLKIGMILKIPVDSGQTVTSIPDDRETVPEAISN